MARRKRQQWSGRPIPLRPAPAAQPQAGRISQLSPSGGPPSPSAQTPDNLPDLNAKSEIDRPKSLFYRERCPRPALAGKILFLHGAQTRLVQDAAIAGYAPAALSRLGTERIECQRAAPLKIAQEIPVGLQARHGGQRREPGRRP